MSQTKTLTKAITMQAGTRKAMGGSKQLPADPFGRMYGEYGLVKPIYPFDRLMELKESNPVHSACIDAKADDIAGLGWQWVAKDGDEEPDAKIKDEIETMLETCNASMSFQEILRAMWEDYEILKWCAMEVVFDGRGLPAELYHVPAHTLRAHKDGKRFAQYISGKLRWFKHVLDQQDYDMDTGEPGEGIPEENKAGSLLVIKKPGGRSAYYGIPEYIASLGAIVGSQAARDFNIGFFTDRTIPDTLLIVEGADVAPDVATDLMAFFSGTKGQHNKLAILPIPTEADGVKARLEKLTPDMKDASFRLYRQDNALEICIAHRVPPYRIGWPITGSLAGTTAEEMTEIYKRSVVEPGQEILEHRLNNHLFSFWDLKGWKWKLNDIDTEDEAADLEYAVKALNNRLMTPNEGRSIIGMTPYPEELEDEGNKFFHPNGQEVGANPTPQPKQQAEGPSQGLPVAPQGEEGSGRDQSSTEQLNKAAEGNTEADEYWTDWVGIHHQQEVKLQEAVADFFVDRRSES